MSNVLQILSSNYSGKSVNISFTSTLGDTLSFENVSLPYNFVNDTFDGTYTLFFPDYNLTNKFQIPEVPIDYTCQCVEFVCSSYINSIGKLEYLTCDGTVRTLSLKSGQSVRDCILIDKYTVSPNVKVIVYDFCTSIKDCNFI
jgi:hypothetical protein